MKKVYRLYVGDQISADGFGKTYRPVEERQKQLEDEVPRLQAEIDFLKVQYLSRGEILSEARDLYGRWGDLTAGEKRKIVETVTERIEIGKDEVAIHLCYVPSPPDLPPSGERLAKRQRDVTGSWRRRAGSGRAGAASPAPVRP